MENAKFIEFFKSPKAILALIIFVFFLKGVFFAGVIPIFQGPDEPLHYSTIHYLSDPKGKRHDSSNENLNFGTTASEIDTFKYSEELNKTAHSARFDEVKFQEKNTQPFTQNFNGENEALIKKGDLNPYIPSKHPSIISGLTLYHKIVSTLIDKPFFNKDIFFRFFASRFFSVLLGTLIILLSFLTAKKIGFSRKNSLLAAAVISFQPMFSFMTSIVNYDALLFLGFSIFIFGAVSLLKDDLKVRNSILLALGIVIAMAAKGTGVVLAVVLFFLVSYYLFYKNKHRTKLFWKYYLLGVLILGLLSVAIIPKSYINIVTNMSGESKFNSPFVSGKEYLETSLANNRISISRSSYWGNFGWLDNKIDPEFIKIIYYIELVSAVGLILYLFDKNRPEYLPERKFIIFFAFIILALQMAIRFYDFRIFDTYGQIMIGTPGRYFLPNIIPHFILIFVGLGYFLKKKEHFEIMLKSIFILMVILYLYSLAIVIIPRYYL